MRFNQRRWLPTAGPVTQHMHAEAALTPTSIFSETWERLARKWNGEDHLVYPREIIFLMGAPGAGKGTNTPFILREREISAPPVVVSDLLNSPEMVAMKGKAELVSDADVVQLLLSTLLEPKYQNGVLVDGFPRTPTQVEIVKLLKDKTHQLYQKHRTNKGTRFQRPSFQVAVLYVDEPTSVHRQLERGQQALSHNRLINTQQGVGGERIEERATDFDPDAARKRYKTFQNHFNTLLSLKKHFTFNIINAAGSIQEVEQKIIREFGFQSALELDQETYDLISGFPTSENLTQHSRQNLIKRLEEYTSWDPELFRKTLNVLETEFLPAFQLNALSGKCNYISTNPLFFEEPKAMKILVDILEERGYNTSVQTDYYTRPSRVGPPGTIEIEPILRCEVRWRSEFFSRNLESPR